VTDVTAIGGPNHYFESNTSTNRGERTNMKKIWTVAALIAVATIPLIIANSKHEKKNKPYIPLAGDANDIFEWELKEQ
jgi:hypothetical protein